MEGLTSSQLIAQGINQIFTGDKKKLDDALKGQGINYFLASLCMFPLTLIKVGVFLCSNKHLFHKHRETYTPVEEMQGIGLSIGELKRHANFLFVNNLQDYNKEIFTKDEKDNEKVTYKQSRLLMFQQMFEKSPYLKGEILNIKRNRVKDSDLIKSAETGELATAFITQRITFGEDINLALKTIIPSLKLKRLRGSEETYVVFENDEVFTLEQKLRGIFMLPITITLKRLNMVK